MIDKDKLAKLIETNQISSEKLLSFLKECDIISADDVRSVDIMNKKKAVLRRHNHLVSQGNGKDRRWFSRVNDPLTGKAKRVAAPTEDELYEKLYDYYFNQANRTKSSPGSAQKSEEKSIRTRKKSYSEMTLQEIYPDWLCYKTKTSSRSNNIRRLDTDYKRFYLDEPLSRDILNIPLVELKPMDVKLWACTLVKKHHLTKKQYGNAMVILRQVLDFLVEQDIIKTNPARMIHIDQGLFRREEKKPAETQIFFPDELCKVLDLAYRLAEEKQDEAYLAIPMATYTGLRPAECLALSFDDFDRKSNTLYVHQSLAIEDKKLPDGTWAPSEYSYQEYLKKNAKPRTICVPDKCFDLLKQIRSIQAKKGIIRSHLFDVKTPNNLERKLYRICDKLGIRRRSPHKLRKTYISTLLNNHMDADFARSQAGHSTLQTTLNCYTYATTRNDTLIKQLNMFVGT